MSCQKLQLNHVLFIFFYCQLNISFPATGCQKLIEVDDERKLRTFYEKRMATEVAADSLGEEWKVRVRKRCQVQSNYLSFPVLHLIRYFYVPYLAGMLKASLKMHVEFNEQARFLVLSFSFFNPHVLDCCAGFLNSFLFLIWVPYQHSKQMKTVPQKCSALNKLKECLNC